MNIKHPKLILFDMSLLVMILVIGLTYFNIKNYFSYTDGETFLVGFGIASMVVFTFLFLVWILNNNTRKNDIKLSDKSDLLGY